MLAAQKVAQGRVVQSAEAAERQGIEAPAGAVPSHEARRLRLRAQFQPGGPIEPPKVLAVEDLCVVCVPLRVAAPKGHRQTATATGMVKAPQEDAKAPAAARASRQHVEEIGAAVGLGRQEAGGKGEKALGPEVKSIDRGIP